MFARAAPAPFLSFASPLVSCRSSRSLVLQAEDTQIHQSCTALSRSTVSSLSSLTRSPLLLKPTTHTRLFSRADGSGGRSLAPRAVFHQQQGSTHFSSNFPSPRLPRIRPFPRLALQRPLPFPFSFTPSSVSLTRTFRPLHPSITIYKSIRPHRHPTASKTQQEQGRPAPRRRCSRHLDHSRRACCWWTGGRRRGGGWKGACCQ